ncbi:MAG: hypothetical protein AB7N70_32165 [Dehalococcoidia bacterium]
MPSAISFRLYLSDEDFGRLFDSASHGVVPSTFNLGGIDGIRASGPDGNDMRWGNKATPVLPIDSALWSFEIAALGDRGSGYRTPTATAFWPPS